MSLAWFLPLPGSYAGVDVVGVYNFACSLREVLAKHPFLPHGCGLFSGSYFPSFSEGLSLRGRQFLLRRLVCRLDFPSFSEGLSLRENHQKLTPNTPRRFPFLFGGTFIEGTTAAIFAQLLCEDFPSFSEGLSLRVKMLKPGDAVISRISLPFRRDFH